MKIPDNKSSSKSANMKIVIPIAVVGVLAVIGVVAIKADSSSSSESTSKSEAVTSFLTTTLPDDSPANNYDTLSNDYYSTPELFAEAFIDAIYRDDMKFIHDNVLVDDTTYLTKEDLEYVIRRTTISHLIGNPPEVKLNYNIKTTGGTSTVSINPYSNNYDINKYFKLELVLSEDNKWQISASNISKDIYRCYVPEGVRFYLNDKEVPINYKVKTENSLDLYEIPNVSYREWNTKLVSSAFGEVNGVIELVKPTQYENNKNNEWDEIPAEIPSELFDEIVEQVTEIYRQVYVMIDNEAPSTDLAPFICSKRDYTYFEQAYYTAIQKYSNLFDDTHKIYNMMVLNVYQNPNVESYVFSDDTVVINVIMEVRWNTSETSIQNNKITTAMKMTKEGNQWLLNEIKSNGWSNIDGVSASEDVGNW